MPLLWTATLWIVTHCLAFAIRYPAPRRRALPLLYWTMPLPRLSVSGYAVPLRHGALPRIALPLLHEGALRRCYALPWHSTAVRCEAMPCLCVAEL